MIDEYAKKDNKSLYKLILIITLSILVVSIVVLTVVGVSKNNKCNNIYDDVEKQVVNYVNKNNLIPAVEGDYVVINISDLPNKVTLKDNPCGGSVKYTKHKDDFVLTYNFENCGYCTTQDNKWSKTVNSYSDRKKNVDVVAKFNYVMVDEYSTKWSNWMASDKLSKEKTDGVYLPLDESVLPKVPEDGIISEIIKEDEIRYSYRDKKWKWYKNASASYSDFSSVAPDGYPNKDTQTEIKSEQSDWSMDYPEEAPYRKISKTTGYRWFKGSGKDKQYWNNGAYYPTAPSDEYKKDSSKSVPMYSYYDKLWRWYSGEKRSYSSYYSVATNGYVYKDEHIYMYTTWSSYKNVSSLDESNKNYREERSDIYSRYLIKYKIKSLPVLDEYISKTEFENKVGMDLEQIYTSDKYEVLVKYEYRYY